MCMVVYRIKARLNAFRVPMGSKVRLTLERRIPIDEVEENEDDQAAADSGLNSPMSGSSSPIPTATVDINIGPGSPGYPVGIDQNNSGNNHNADDLIQSYINGEAMGNIKSFVEAQNTLKQMLFSRNS